jgi:8-oxo-dGTP pyrophosphatase MutT (NUDIX family)
MSEFGTPIVVVRGLITDEINELLFTQRADTCRTNGGKWEFPGGKLEEDERKQPIAGLYREIYEEAAIETILDPAVFRTDQHVFIDTDGKRRRRITTFYLGMSATNCIVPDYTEVMDAQWATVTEARELDLTEGSRGALEEYHTLLQKIG